MEKQSFGLVMFLIGAVYLIVMSWGGGWGWFISSPEQISETVGVMDNVLYFLWAFSAPLGAILASIGILLHVQSKGSRIALLGIGGFLAVLSAGVLLYLPSNPLPHYPTFFAVGGGLILVFFLAILWFWSKKWTALKGPEKRAASFQLAGYVFFILAAWYLYGTFTDRFIGRQFEVLSIIMIFIVLGWLFLLLSHYIYARVEKLQVIV